MTNQWPQPRSLKDDPPQGFNDILIADHTGWKLIGSSSEAKFFLESGYTHWLPAPSAPPEPSQPWKLAWDQWYGAQPLDTKYPFNQHPFNPSASAEAFKAGWNAALEAVDDGRDLISPKSHCMNEAEIDDAMALTGQICEKLKAP